MVRRAEGSIWSGATTIASQDAAQETIESLGQSVFMHGHAESSDAPKGAESGRLFLPGAPAALLHARTLIGDVSTNQDRIRACLHGLLTEMNVRTVNNEQQAVASLHAAIAIPMRTDKLSISATVKEYGASRSTYYEWVKRVAQLDEHIAANAGRVTAVTALSDMAASDMAAAAGPGAMQAGMVHGLPSVDTTGKRARAVADAKTHLFIGTTGDPNRPVRLTLVVKSPVGTNRR